MIETTNTLSLRPIISYPREVRAGATYIMQIDIHSYEENWTYDKEECAIHCIVDTYPLFESKAIGDPIVVVHRFGGSYGPVIFQLKANDALIPGSISVTLVSESGSIETIHLNDINILPKLPNPTVEVLEITLSLEDNNRIVVYRTDTMSHYVDSSELLKLVSDATSNRNKSLQMPPEQFGHALYNNVFGIGTVVRNALDAGPERIVLTTTAPSLRAIPWELLHDGKVFVVTRTSFVRGIPPSLRQPSPISLGSLGIMVIPSNPLETTLESIDVDKEWMNLSQAINKAQRAVKLERVRPPTMTQLTKLVVDKHQIVIHFTGYEGSSEINRLLFEKESGQADPIPIDKFIGLIRDSTFLVLLNASVSVGPGDTLFNSYTEELALRNVPYALGMSFLAKDEVAGIFLQELYGQLAQGIPIEEALRLARVKLARSSWPWAVGIPILYTSLNAAASGFITPQGPHEIILHQPPLEVEPVLTQAEGSFQGRIQELQVLGQALTGDAPAGLMTIHSMGGQGKTALAREAVERFAWAWRGGVWATSLESLPTRALFVHSLARFLQLITPDDMSDNILEQSVLSRLSQTPVLIVLDNAETLVQAIETGSEDAYQLTEFLRYQVRGTLASLLVISHEMLSWEGETVLNLGGLLPEEGVALFAENAQMSFNGIDKDLVRNLSLQVAGHPLSLTLLGKIFKETKMSMADFVADYEKHLLSSSYVDEYQRLYSAIGISISSLSNNLQYLFGNLGVFHAPFLPESAVELFGLDNPSNENDLSHIVDGLHQLWMRSLLERSETTIRDEVVLMYRLSPILRLYTETYMGQRLPLEQRLARITGTYANLANQLYQSIDRSSLAAFVAQQVWPDMQRIASNLSPNTEINGYFLLHWGWIVGWLGDRSTAFRLASHAFECAQLLRHDELTLNALGSMAGIYVDIGQPRQALALYEQALPLQRVAGDPVGEAAILSNMAMVYHVIGQPRQALALYEQALSLQRVAGDRAGEAITLNNMAGIYRDTSQLALAQELYEQALPLRREVGDRAGEATTMNNMALIYHTMGRPLAALNLYEQALVLRREVGDRAGEATTMNNMAGIYSDIGQPIQALELYEQVLPVRRAVGDRLGETATLNGLAYVLMTLMRYSEAQDIFQQSIDIAHEVNHPASESAGWVGLAVLLARYLTQPGEALRCGKNALAILEQTGLSQTASGQTSEAIKTFLFHLESGTFIPDHAVQTIPIEQQQLIVTNTISVLTKLPENLKEWRTTIDELLQRARANGPNWQIEIDFYTGILALLEGQSLMPLAETHPYNWALAQILEGIQDHDEQEWTLSAPNQEDIASSSTHHSKVNITIPELLPLLYRRCETVSERLIFLHEVFGAQSTLLNNITYEGSTHEFIVNLVTKFAHDSEVLNALLDVVMKDDVGDHRGFDIESLHLALSEWAAAEASKSYFESQATSLRAQTTKPVFISYSRQDRNTVLKLYTDLKALGFRLWRDLHDIQGDGPLWEDIKQGIDSCDSVVLCMSPDALNSRFVQAEWNYAHEQGKRIVPLKLAEVDFASVSGWMRRIEWKDFHKGKPKSEVAWVSLIKTLNTPYPSRKVPFMAQPLPPYFIERPTEFEPLVNALVGQQRTVAITAAVKGAGGFGKTTLAMALCHDNRIKGIFDDGILWVTLGETPSESDLLKKALDLVYELTGTRPSIEGREAAKAELTKAIGDRSLLLVLDDLWRKADANLFLTQAKNCAVLITTRLDTQLPEQTRFKQNVDAMRLQQAVDLLTWNIAGIRSIHRPALQSLAQRLGEWAVLLRLVNATLRKRLRSGGSLTKALEYAEQALIRKGLNAFDSSDPRARASAIGSTLKVSLDLLTVEQQAQFAHLAIFPEDTIIPFTTLEKLWQLDVFDTEATVIAMNDAGLLLNFELGQRIIGLHDVVRQYLIDEHHLDLPKWQAHFIAALGDLHILPDVYIWCHIAYHLREAGRIETLRTLLLNFDWLQAKLNATDVNALLADFEGLSHDEALRLVESALSMSAHVISHDKTKLALQLYGRLLTYQQQQSDLVPLLQTAVANQGHLYLLHPTLSQAGGALIRTIPLENSGNSLALTDDGEHLVVADGEQVKIFEWRTGILVTVFNQHIDGVNWVTVQGDLVFSASSDNTVKVWRWATGELLTNFTQHTSAVNGVSIQGEMAFTASNDQTVKVWRWATGELLISFREHTDWVRSVTTQGELAFSTSYDRTVKVWRWATGELVTNFRGHAEKINAVSVQGDLAFSASWDRTVKVWRWATGELLTTFSQHTDWVNAVSVQGDLAFSTSNNGNIQIWRWATGEQLTSFIPHTDWVNAVSVQDDLAFSASDDKTVKVWHWESGELLTDFVQHTGAVNGVSVQGDLAFSASDDGTVKIWRWSTGDLVSTFMGHTDRVNDVSVQGELIFSASSDNTVQVRRWMTGELVSTFTMHTNWLRAVHIQGELAFSVSLDKTVKVWRWTTGEILTDFKQHTDWVNGVGVQGELVVSASNDQTVKVWRWATGEVLTTFSQHTGNVTGVLMWGELVVSVSSDQTMKLWRWRTGEVIAAFAAEAPLTCVTFEPVQRLLLVGDEQGHVHVLRVVGLDHLLFLGEL